MGNKRILFIIKGGREWIGGLHYTKNLIKTISGYCLRHNVPVSISLLVYEQEQVKLFNDVKSSLDQIFVYNKDLPKASLPNRIRWRIGRSMGIFNGRLDDFIVQQRFDFVYPALPRKDFSKYRFAEWIPDFQYRHFPEGSNADEIEGRKKEFGFIAANSPLVYLSSEHGRKDCEELFPVSKGKTAVMRFCVHTDAVEFKLPLEKAIAQYNIPRKYFVVSNLLAPTKNLQVVIGAVSLLKARGIHVPVVVTGDVHDYRNPEFKHMILQLISEKNVREQIILLGLIDRTLQRQLLVNSIAIIQPSRFEGWNTLVEEAKSIDKKIILSDIPVHVEQAPLSCEYFKDNDAEDLAAVLAKEYERPVSEEITAISVSGNYEQDIEAFAAHFMNVSFDQSL